MSRPICPKCKRGAIKWEDGTDTNDPELLINGTLVCERCDFKSKGLKKLIEGTERPHQWDFFDIDLTDLREACSSWLDEVEAHETEDSDTPHYIFEIAMKTIYGKDIFKYINELL